MHTITYDRASERVLFFGVFNARGDTWQLYNPNPATFVGGGTACPTSNGRPPVLAAKTGSSSVAR